MADDLLDDDDDIFGEAPPSVAPQPLIQDEDDGDDLDSMAGPKNEARGLEKPWMKFHKFTLVKTVDEVKAVVDSALAHGSCGLDLETEGFDNRINYNEDGTCHTIHRIVGFCISVRAHGYYIPVRHKWDEFADTDPNVPVAAVEAEITRLCWESQPILTEEGQAEDPMGSAKMKTPPRVRMGFWNAKFDQEFLYPITGLELWHPDSFEDGLLAAFALYSDDHEKGLKGKAEQNLIIFDPEKSVNGKPKAYRYEMIEFKELFPSGVKDPKFYDLYPTDGNEVTLYGCSDAICTELMCFPETNWDHTQPNLNYSYTSVCEKALAKRHLFTYRLEKQTTQAVRDIERQRVKINHPAVEALRLRAEEEKAKYHGLIVDLAEKKGFKNFNPESPKQLATFLFEEEGLNISPKPAKNEASKCYKTDAATLESLVETAGTPVLDWIVKNRQITKIVGTYLTSMSKNCDSHDCLRFKFNQTGAATGRFTAPSGEVDHGYAGIPPQGIPASYDPKKPEVAHSLRSAFVARDGYTMVKVDYAGQELRIVTNLSNEELWVKEFLRPHGGDLHTLTAQAFFGSHITKKDKTERDMSKKANFALIYGGGPQAIMRATGCDKVEGARRKANFDKSVPTFASWVKGQHAKVKKDKGVWNAFYRFLAIPDADIKEGDRDAKGNIISAEDVRKIKAACERKATNYPIQSCICAGTLILTKDGWQPIETLSTCEVWTGTKWAGAKAKDMGKHPLATIQLKDGTTISCDTNHKLLVVTDEEYSWVEYKDLEPGMNIATAIHEPVEFNSKEPEDTTELWYWIGRYFSGDQGITGNHLLSSMNKVLGTGTVLNGVNRIPLKILNETLANRRQFVIGFMDSEEIRKGGHYKWHLYQQRPILVDLKLLFRTMGVETTIRGPYKGSNKNGGPTTSYRLDINRRMFEKHMMGTPRTRLSKLDMFVPRFLVEELLSHDLHTKDFGADKSAAAKYSQLKVGGRITVYAFKHLCELAGIILSQPLYGYKQLVSKEEKGTIDTTYTLSVDDPLHRFEAEGVITKNSGADILKISLVQLIKEFQKRGWRRNGGDDSVRMIMTIHDEIVFEIKHERLVEALPVIKKIMEAPSRLAQWKVPLVVEPLIDLSWSAKYDWDKIMSGEEPVPEWLVGIVTPGVSPEEAPQKVVPLTPSPTTSIETKPLSMPPKAVSKPSSIVPPSGTLKVAVFAMHDTSFSANTAKLVIVAIAKAFDCNSNTYFKLVDNNGRVILSPSAKRIPIQPERMKIALQESRLGMGDFTLKEEAL